MAENKNALQLRGHLQPGRCAFAGVRRTGIFPELVIAFGDEQSLPELIADPRAVGIVVGSREAIAAIVRIDSSGAANSATTPVKAALAPKDAPVSPESSACTSSTLGLRDARRMAYASLQQLAAAALVILYSKSVIGTALRTFIGN